MRALPSIIFGLLVASPVAATQCDVTGIAYDFDEGRSNSITGMLVLHVKATPRDEQRTFSGSVQVYFHVQDQYGVEQKESSLAYFNDSAPEGETTTDIDVKFSAGFYVFGTVLDVYDIKMKAFNCSTD